MRVRFMLAAAALALAPLVAPQAAMIDQCNYTIDSRTGLDWLKLNVLAGYSYNQVASGSVGYVGSGWRYANLNELLNLFTIYVGPTNGGYSSDFPISGMSPNYLIGAESLVISMGMNLAFNDLRATYNVQQYEPMHQISIQGFFEADPSHPGYVGLAEATAVLNTGDTYTETVGRWLLSQSFMPIGQYGINISSFLVRGETVAVPEPASIILFGAGLLGLGLANRRRKKASATSDACAA